MNNPIIIALVPYVAGTVQRPLVLDTYGPTARPAGVIILSKLDDGTEVEISRHAISGTQTEFARWFAEAIEWLRRRT
jgi:hypothetical protein